jgi:hypothetical protein
MRRATAAWALLECPQFRSLRLLDDLNDKHGCPSRPVHGEALLTEKYNQDEAARLRQLIMGFRVTQLIHIAAKLELSDHLARGPLTAQELASMVGVEQVPSIGCCVHWRASAYLPRRPMLALR